MDRLRRDLREMFGQRQARLGDVREARGRLMQAALARKDEPLDRHAQLIAGLAAALIAALLVVTFVYVRGASSRYAVGAATPARTTKPTPSAPLLPPVKSPAPGFLVVAYDGDASDASHGWALVTNCVQPMQGRCQYAVQSTSDAGRTWTRPVHVGGDFDPGNGDAPRRVLFINPSDGFVFGGQGVYVTHDAGRTWSALSLNAAFAGDLAGRGQFVTVTAYPCAKGVVCPYQVLSSTDGGRTWSQPRSLPVGFEPDHGVAFSDTGEILWGQFSGAMEVTRDAGAAWRSINTPCATGSILNVAFATPDGTELWEVCLHYPSPADAVSSRREMFVSEDSGADWVSLPIKPVPTEQASVGFYMIAASSRPASLVVASNQTSMMITHDGGATWKNVGPDNLGFHSIRFVNDRVGVAIDTAHGMWITNDGGDQWTEWPIEVTSPLGP